MSDLKNLENKDVEPPQQSSSISAEGDTRSQTEQVSRKIDRSKAHLTAGEIKRPWRMNLDELKALTGRLDGSKAYLAAAEVTRSWQMDRDKLQALVGRLDGSKAYLAAAEVTRQWQMDRDKLKALVGGLDSSKALLAAAGVMRPWQVGGDELKAFVASTFVGSKAFQALVNADSATLSAVAAGLSAQDEFVSSALAVSDFASLEVSSPLESAEAEVVSVLTGGGDVSALSSRASGLLHYVFWAFMLLMNYLDVQNGVREELCFLQPKLMPGLTVGQAGKAIRAVMCKGEVPEEFLRNYRMVKGEGVRLRVEPSMKAALVQVSLEDRALLEILDSSNRDWLYVSVMSEEGVHGWISRKYTHQLLK